QPTCPPGGLFLCLATATNQPHAHRISTSIWTRLTCVGSASFSPFLSILMVYFSPGLHASMNTVLTLRTWPPWVTWIPPRCINCMSLSPHDREISKSTSLPVKSVLLYPVHQPSDNCIWAPCNFVGVIP